MSGFLRTLYRLALLAFPADFRRRFATHLIETFEFYQADVGNLAASRAVLEAVTQGLRERSARLVDTIPGRRIRPMVEPTSYTQSGVIMRLSGFVRDARYAIRGLRRSPVFAVTALIILTVGIGASTSVFSVLDALVLRSLPFPDADRLVTLTETYQPESGALETRAASYPDFRDWRDNTSAFSELGISDFQNVALSAGQGEPEMVVAGFMSPAVFRMLGIRPALGRLLIDDDDEPGNLVAVVGHDLWVTRWGGDSSIIGSSVTVNDRAATIIGIAEEGFDGTYGGVVVWFPFRAEGAFVPNRPIEFVERRGVRGFGVVGRLNDGVSLSEAQRQLDVVTSDLRASGVLSNQRGVMVEFFEDVNLGDARELVLVLALAVGLVLLIACANVANLLLARQLGRTREIALRRAIGADRGVIVRQLLVESLVLGGLGGVGGAALAVWLTGIVGSTIVSSVPSYIAPVVDIKALAFALIVSLLTGITFGMVPALHARGGRISEALRTSPRSDAAGAGGFATRRVLVIGQVAIAIPLLVGSGLMIRSISNALAIDPGFESGGVGVASVNLPSTRYDPPTLAAFAQQLEVNIAERAGIEAVAVASDVPLNAGYTASNFEPADPRYAGQSYRGYFHFVSPHYFETLGIPIVEGRAFEATDRQDARPVVIVSEQLADRFWPGSSPLGQLIDGAAVVGVVRNAMYRSLIPNAEVFPNDPDIFLPLSQSPRSSLQIAVRGEITAVEVTEVIRSEVQRLDPALAVFGVASLEDLVENQVAGRRAATQQLGAFALIALLLAVGGLFGVMAYSVGRQAGEIGLRMALGATRGRIVSRFIGQATILMVAGVVIGTGLSLAILRFLESQLYGVSTADPRTFLFAGAAFVAVGLCAATIPAMRAARIDPLIALRSD